MYSQAPSQSLPADHQHYSMMTTDSNLPHSSIRAGSGLSQSRPRERIIPPDVQRTFNGPKAPISYVSPVFSGAGLHTPVHVSPGFEVTQLLLVRCLKF